MGYTMHTQHVRVLNIKSVCNTILFANPKYQALELKWMMPLHLYVNKKKNLKMLWVITTASSELNPYTFDPLGAVWSGLILFAI